MAEIRALDSRAEAAARARQRDLLKPPRSLGRLEELAVWMAAVSGNPRPELRPLVVIAVADHGVAAQGVSAYPQAVTGQMLSAFRLGGSAIGAIAAHLDVPVRVVDAGVASASPADGVTQTGLRPSADITIEPALTENELVLALRAGRDLAAEAAEEGFNLLVGGDMGIANTTPSTCLAAWITGSDPSALCGRGTGIDDAGLERKRLAVERALSLHDPAGPLEALRCLGGGELAVLCGLALGAGENGLGYMCDGLPATAAAAVAVAIAPGLERRLLAGHRSPEPAHSVLLGHLGLTPVLDLGMRLGEASGAASALAVLRVACAVHNGMATFAETGVSGPVH